jgi:hypothetical protein
MASSLHPPSSRCNSISTFGRKANKGLKEEAMNRFWNRKVLGNQRGFTLIE